MIVGSDIHAPLRGVAAGTTLGAATTGGVATGTTTTGFSGGAASGKGLAAFSTTSAAGGVGGLGGTGGPPKIASRWEENDCFQPMKIRMSRTKKATKSRTVGGVS